MKIVSVGFIFWTIKAIISLGNSPLFIDLKFILSIANSNWGIKIHKKVIEIINDLVKDLVFFEKLILSNGLTINSKNNGIKNKIRRLENG